MTTIVEVGIRLREERDRLGLKQDELAERLRVSRTSQSNYERGERAPDAEYLAACGRLGMDVAYVVTGVRGNPYAVPQGEPSATVLTLQEAALIDNYRHASEQGRRALEATGAALAKPDKAVSNGK